VTLGRTSLRAPAACCKHEGQEVINIRGTVKDVMTTSVVAVRKDASFKEMAAMLRSRRISAFPVLDDAGRVIGVVSEGDLLVKEAVQADGTSLFAALRHLREDDKAAGITAGDLMSGPAVTIGPDAPVEEAARLMYDRRVKRLPVVNAAGRLLGIISRVDVLAVFSRPDDDIRDEVVHRVIPGLTPAEPKDFSVAVTDGIVTISGERQSDQLGRAVVDAIRHIQGVVAVRDRLSGPSSD
jgi:CBS domain-containing protein